MANKFIRENNGLKIDTASLNNLNTFIQTQISIFKVYENYVDKDQWFNLFDQIYSRIDDDLSNAVFDFQGLEHVIHNIEQTKKSIILYYNIGYVLGTIVFNVFDEPNNRLVGITEGFEGAVTPRELLKYGYLELVQHKRNNDSSPAFGASFVFSSLIEEELKTHIKRFYAAKYLKELQDKIKNNLVVLATDEDELFDYLCYNYEICSQRRFQKEFDSIYANGTKQFELLNNYTDITNYPHINKLFDRSVTLNQLRTESYFESVVDDRFKKMLLYIFGTGNLNLRNNFAHANLTYVNYHYLGFTSVLFLLTHFIANEFFYKNGI